MIFDDSVWAFRFRPFKDEKNCSSVPVRLQLLFLLTPNFLGSSSWGSLVRICQKQT